MPPRRLRTVCEGFPSHGSSLHERLQRLVDHPRLPRSSRSCATRLLHRHPRRQGPSLGRWPGRTREGSCRGWRRSDRREPTANVRELRRPTLRSAWSELFASRAPPRPNDAIRRRTYSHPTTPSSPVWKKFNAIWMVVSAGRTYSGSISLATPSYTKNTSSSSTGAGVLALAVRNPPSAPRGRYSANPQGPPSPRYKVPCCGERSLSNRGSVPAKPAKTSRKCSSSRIDSHAAVAVPNSPLAPSDSIQLAIINYPQGTERSGSRGLRMRDGWQNALCGVPPAITPERPPEVVRL